MEKLSEKKAYHCHKLVPFADGPFQVMKLKRQTLVIEHNAKTREEVSIDRIERAPPPIGEQDVDLRTGDQ